VEPPLGFRHRGGIGGIEFVAGVASRIHHDLPCHVWPSFSCTTLVSIAEATRPRKERFCSACLDVAGTHSYLAAVRRTDRIPLWHLLGVFVTLQKAKSIARHLGLTLRQLSRELPRWKRDHGLLHRQARRRR